MRLFLAAVLAPLLLTAASDPFVGAWKLIPKKLTFEKGSQPPPPGVTWRTPEKATWSE
jgi:hypothetical protein